MICDPGIDDMLAVMVLAGLDRSPESLVATAGNVDLDTAHRNTSGIIEALGLSSRLGRGAATAIAGPYPAPGGPFHGPDGLGGTGSTLQRLSAGGSPHSDALTLIEESVFVTAPLTLVAEALRAGRPIKEVLWMGGSFAVAGNVTPVAEYNAWMDPEAADDVLNSRAIVSVVPLDVTHQVGLEAGDLEELGSRGHLAQLAATACRYICDRDGVIFPHDATAAIAQTDPDLFAWEERSVRCETTGTFTRDMTVADRRRHASRGEVRIAMGVDTRAVKNRLLEALHNLG
jgi:inosine-uridine nucleoside N-ribohydrolase